MWVAFHENGGKTAEIAKTTKMTKTTQAAKNEEMSAGLAEIMEAASTTRTMRIRGANHGFTIQQV